VIDASSFAVLTTTALQRIALGYVERARRFRQELREQPPPPSAR